jgi:mono/diheme cytochrome c family protein
VTVGRGRVLIALALAVAAPLLAVSASLAARGGPAAAKPVTITVTARDYSFKLSAKTAPVGKVTFAVKNTGKKNHSFQIAGKKTPVLKPGKSAKLVVTFTKAGPFAYTSTVAGDAAKGMKGTFTTKAAAPAVNLSAGKAIFAANACAGCHTLKAAGATGTIGPNLDRSTASLATVTARITTGKGVMQGYAGTLSEKEIKDVADFVFQSRTGM